MSERKECYLCGEKAEFKTVGELEGVRCSNCKLHYQVAHKALVFHFYKPHDLDRVDKMKIRDHLKEIGCGDDSSDNPKLITSDMINLIKEHTIPEK